MGRAHQARRARPRVDSLRANEPTRGCAGRRALPRARQRGQHAGEALPDFNRPAEIRIDF